MEIEWTDADPATGERRYVCAVKFARKWSFKVRLHRRAPWEKDAPVTRDMWETLLEAMERRYRRREGVTDEDLAVVRKALKDYREPPGVEEEINHKGTKDTKETEDGRES